MAKKQYPSDKQDQFMLRLPDGLRDRIKDEAAKNNRSMNAEIVSTLEAVYPPKTMDVQALTEFLDALVGGDDPRENEEYLERVNDILSKTKRPYTAKAGWDGVVSFYPYASPAKRDEPTGEKD